MSDPSFGPLRIWKDETGSSEAGIVSSSAPHESLHQRLASDEILRPTLRLRESFEPLTLAWYQELERLRYHRHGRWIPRLLDFGKYHGERLLGLGTSLGSDLVNYAVGGVEVVIANPIADLLGLIRRNFELRHLPGSFLHAYPKALPIETASVDVVYINGLLHEADEPSRVVEETYRVLKPGGKLVALVPARAEIDFMTKLGKLLRIPQPTAHAVERGLFSSSASPFDRRSLTQLLSRFQEGRIYRRHLRRAEVPHLCRWLPLGMLERLTGRLLLFKGFKPVSAARAESLAA